MKNEATPPAQAKQTFATDASNPIVFNKTANWVWESPRGLAKPGGCFHFPPQKSLLCFRELIQLDTSGDTEAGDK